MINTVKTAIPIPYTQIAAFCEQHRIVRMWLFGSILRSDFAVDSDIDVMNAQDKLRLQPMRDAAVNARRFIVDKTRDDLEQVIDALNRILDNP